MQPGDVGVGVHEPAVAVLVGSPHFDDVVVLDATTAVHGTHQVGQQVGDRDRLHSGLGHPARSQHRRQHLDQTAQHLERRRARTEDDRGAYLGDRDRTGGQFHADVVARPEMRRQIVIIIAETTHVHDVSHTAAFRSHPGVSCRHAFLLHEVVTHTERVHEIHDLVDAVECGSD